MVSKNTVLVVALCLVIVSAIVAVLIFTAPKVVRAQVEITPDVVDLELDYAFFKVVVTLPNSHKVEDINMSTVMLEDVVSPTSWKIENGQLILEFDGDAVINLIQSKIYHMGFPIDKRIGLEISGKLVDGMPFEGSDTVRVIT